MAKSPQTAGFASLYSFKGPPDGAFPLAPLLHAGDSLYGTTSQGGTVTGNGDGTILSSRFPGAKPYCTASRAVRTVSFHKPA